MKVLIVDDSKVMRIKLKSIVSAAGVPVDTFLEAANGREALERIDVDLPDIMFTDINMPEMDGRQLLREIATRQLPKTPFMVVCTTETPEHLKTELTGYGVRAYIEKPFDTNAIRDFLIKASAAA